MSSLAIALTIVAPAILPTCTDVKAAYKGSGCCAEKTGSLDSTPEFCLGQTFDLPSTPKKYDSGLIAYEGITYATAARFERSKPLAFDLGSGSNPPKCSQAENGAIAGEEDCLYLNVYTKPGRTNVPVVFYMHGGGQDTGSLMDTDAQPASFVENYPVVWVAIQYRLNIMGGACTADLAAESDAAGAYGIDDAFTALKWVKANVAKFGGDPNNIVVTGCSGGAVQALEMLSSPLACEADGTKAFHKALPISAFFGGFPGILRAQTCAEKEAMLSASFGGATGAALTATMKALPRDALHAIALNPLWESRPTSGSAVMPQPVTDLSNKCGIPTMISQGTNEVGFFAALSQMMGMPPGGLLSPEWFIQSQARPQFLAHFNATGALTPERMAYYFFEDDKTLASYVYTLTGHFGATELAKDSPTGTNIYMNFISAGPFDDPYYDGMHCSSSAMFGDISRLYAQGLGFPGTPTSATDPTKIAAFSAASAGYQAKVYEFMTTGAVAGWPNFATDPSTGSVNILETSNGGEKVVSLAEFYDGKLKEYADKWYPLAPQSFSGGV